MLFVLFLHIVLMQHATGDETADFLLRQLAFLKRVGSPSQKAAAPKWEMIVRTHAVPVVEEAAASFATVKPETPTAPEGR